MIRTKLSRENLVFTILNFFLKRKSEISVRSSTLKVVEISPNVSEEKNLLGADWKVMIFKDGQGKSVRFQMLEESSFSQTGCHRRPNCPVDTVINLQLCRRGRDGFLPFVLGICAKVIATFYPRIPTRLPNSNFRADISYTTHRNPRNLTLKIKLDQMLLCHSFLIILIICTCVSHLFKSCFFGSLT